MRRQCSRRCDPPEQTPCHDTAAAQCGARLHSASETSHFIQVTVAQLMSSAKFKPHVTHNHLCRNAAAFKGSDKQPKSERRVDASRPRPVFILMQEAVIFVLMRWRNQHCDGSSSVSQRSTINRHLVNYQGFFGQSHKYSISCASDFEQ